LVKTITIRDEIYRKLLTIKRKDDSFSELFDRLAENKDPIETLTKLRAKVEFREKEEMLSEMHSSRTEQRR
jgi:predicted CopG family antitoxin